MAAMASLPGENGSSGADEKIELVRRLVVSNANGLHARPASLLVETANRFRSKIVLARDALAVDAKSILNIMMLAAEQGAVLELRVRGEDSEAAVEAIVRLFLENFGES